MTRVTLATVSGGERVQFDIDHAERILAIKNSGWELPKDSDFEYVNGIISRRDKKKNR